MRFYGDIALPDCVNMNIEKGNATLNDQVSIANMEGLISGDIEGGCLYNGIKVLDVFKLLNIKAVSLANNHVNDLSEKFDNTVRLLERNGIQWFGAGKTLKEARNPVVLEENGIKYVIFGFGWNVIGCRKNRKTDLYINQLNENNVLKSVFEAIRRYENSRIILFFHWDYELEIYPQPYHRELAQKSINAGAYAVIGSHPHCVQNIEIYKDHVVAYSLGNFAIPNGYYIDGKLIYPNISEHEMVVELDENKNRFLHFRYDGDNTIAMLDDYALEDINAPYSCYNKELYIKWFRKNRRKKKLLPVFTSGSTINNIIKYQWVKMRENMIKLLLRLKLKAGPS